MPRAMLIRRLRDVLAAMRRPGRAGDMTREADGTTVMKFRDDEEGYRDWLRQNPGGWVLNKDTAERPLKLHRADCDTISTPCLPRTINGLTKFCSTDRDALVTYARDLAELSLGCPFCCP